MELDHHIPRIQFGQEEAFLTLWAMRLPIVVQLGHRFKGLWGPQVLSDLYGEEQIMMIEVNEALEVAEHEVKLSAFFQRFSRSAMTDKWAIKVKVS